MRHPGLSIPHGQRVVGFDPLRGRIDRVGLLRRGEPGDASEHHECERIRQSVEERDLMHTDQRVVISVSIGVTSLGAGLATGDIQLLETADKALYEAKHQGRNRVVFQSLT